MDSLDKAPADNPDAAVEVADLAVEMEAEQELQVEDSCTVADHPDQPGLEVDHELRIALAVDQVALLGHHQCDSDHTKLKQARKLPEKIQDGTDIVG